MTALAIAALLVGPAGAKALKGTFDHRKGFYPEPVVRGRRGRAHKHDARGVVARASREGYVSAEQARAAFEVLDRMAAELPPSIG